MKRPAFQFYPADWRKDVELRSCSVAARGLWIDLMCVAHDCEPYGHLILNGRPMTPAQMAGQVGNISPAQLKKLLDELIENGVARVTPEGAIYSKRMVDDERVRNARAEGGKAGGEHGSKGGSHGNKGGRPKSPKGGSETPLETPLEPELKPPPSSSSSSSTSSLRSEAAGAKPEPPSAAPDPQPSAAGLACRAMRQAGLTDVSPSDPRLLALLAQGIAVDEFAAVAAEAKAKGKGWSWVLAVVKGRRADAAQIAATTTAAAPAPAADPNAWQQTRSGVIHRANQLGIGPWNEVDAHVGVGPSWGAYKRQVIEADAQQRQGGSA
ncbi:hypothetical protein [Eleftheria terrae]|uniref:hypothetical protein n=1 Tax=Eleftheria terrae TaxID=1597781 RepID=UPI00263A6825|nr:hypothetical protein [Eleftheria terrae]WKB53000.1 hypothetical protein N7L95_00935 [Eleftheria terrae]